MKKRFSIPSKFELSNDIALNNSDFHLVKLRIMSSGENWNGSSFTIDSLEKAKNTVSYAPILANIVERNDGELDANGHDINMELTIDYKGNASFKETYIEKPVGVFISNSCEKKYDQENDVYYLQAYGVIWKTYSQIYDILKRDEVKDVSVEISVEKGEFRDDGYYEIQDYNVLGCTILGNGNLPAIDNSRIEFNFSKDSEYTNNLEQLNILLQNFYKGGGIYEMEENQNEQVLDEVVEPQAFAEEGEEEKVCEECGKPLSECECKEDDEEFAQEDEEVCEECGKPLSECECAEDEEMAKKKKKKCSCEECEDEVVEEAIEEFAEEDAIEIPVIVEEKLYTQADLNMAIANTRAEFEDAMEELEILREFKAQYDREVKLQQLNDAMDEIANNFNVNVELLNQLKEKVILGEYSLDKFELELYRNNMPIKKEFKKEEKQKLPIIDNSKEMNAIDSFFAKYNVPKK